jgi:DtxR family manganese transport transcriptional regulator
LASPAPTTRRGDLPTEPTQARRFGKARTAQSSALSEDYVEFLTEAGERLAERVRARHRVVVDLLLAVGVPAEAAEQDAEGIEHHVSDTSLAAFGRFLRRRA